MTYPASRRTRRQLFRTKVREREPFRKKVGRERDTNCFGLLALLLIRIKIISVTMIFRIIMLVWIIHHWQFIGTQRRGRYTTRISGGRQPATKNISPAPPRRTMRSNHSSLLLILSLLFRLNLISFLLLLLNNSINLTIHSTRWASSRLQRRDLVLLGSRLLGLLEHYGF